MRLNEMNAGYNRLQLQERRIYGGVATKGVRYLYDVMYSHHFTCIV